MGQSGLRPDRKTPFTAADLLNDCVIPLFESHDVNLMRMLTERERHGGTTYYFCG